MSENEKKKLLEIKDLKIYYPIKGKLNWSTEQTCS